MMPSPPGPDNSPLYGFNTSASLQGITLQHLQNAEDHYPGCDPRITQGWDQLSNVAGILDKHRSIMDSGDVKVILKGLIRMIGSGDKIQELLAPVNERRPFWRRISFFRANSKLALQEEIEAFHFESSQLRFAAVRSSTKALGAQLWESNGEGPFPLGNLSSTTDAEFEGSLHDLPEDASALPPDTPTQESFQREAQNEANMLSLPAYIVTQTSTELTLAVGLQSPQPGAAPLSGSPGTEVEPRNQDQVVLVRIPTASPLGSRLEAQLSTP